MLRSGWWFGFDLGVLCLVRSEFVACFKSFLSRFLLLVWLVVVCVYLRLGFGLGCLFYLWFCGLYSMFWI